MSESSLSDVLNEMLWLIDADNFTTNISVVNVPELMNVHKFTDSTCTAMPSETMGSTMVDKEQSTKKVNH